MKIRIKGNSLRYRLTKSDVDKLSATGNVSESIRFGNTALHYQLQSDNVSELAASFDNNCITVYFPSGWIDRWINTDEVGYKHFADDNDHEGEPSIIVEKDFTCLDNVAEDQSDNYPNPLMQGK